MTGRREWLRFLLALRLEHQAAVRLRAGLVPVVDRRDARPFRVRHLGPHRPVVRPPEAEPVYDLRGLRLFVALGLHLRARGEEGSEEEATEAATVAIDGQDDFGGRGGGYNCAGRPPAAEPETQVPDRRPDGQAGGAGQRDAPGRVERAAVGRRPHVDAERPLGSVERVAGREQRALCFPGAQGIGGGGGEEGGGAEGEGEGERSAGGRGESGGACLETGPKVVLRMYDYFGISKTWAELPGVKWQTSLDARFAEFKGADEPDRIRVRQTKLQNGIIALSLVWDEESLMKCASLKVGYLVCKKKTRLAPATIGLPNQDPPARQARTDHC